jgi:predicted Zn finger-like uncharacterized protein
MSVEFQCPACAGVFRITIEQEGQKVRCPICGQKIRIPEKANTNAKTILAPMPEEIKEALDQLPAVAPDAKCPFCQGVIAAGEWLCPHCRSVVIAPQSPPVAKRLGPPPLRRRRSPQKDDEVGRRRDVFASFRFWSKVLLFGGLFFFSVSLVMDVTKVVDGPFGPVRVRDLDLMQSRHYGLIFGGAAFALGLICSLALAIHKSRKDD